MLLLDDDASIVRMHVPLQHYLEVFAGDSIILASAGWATFVPAPGGGVLKRETWDVPRTTNPRGFEPAPYAPNTGVMLYVNTTYTRTLLGMLLADNATRCAPYNGGNCCFEQDALLAATMTTWQTHVGMVPALAPALTLLDPPRPYSTFYLPVLDPFSTHTRPLLDPATAHRLDSALSHHPRPPLRPPRLSCACPDAPPPKPTLDPGRRSKLIFNSVRVIVSMITIRPRWAAGGRQVEAAGGGGR